MYESVLKSLDRWLDGRDLTDSLLADHLQFLHHAKLSFSRCALCIAAVNFCARLHGVPSPVQEQTERLLLVLRRASSTPGFPVVGVRHERVRLLVEQIALENTTRALRDAAMIACASDALLRVSELKQIKVSDISYKPDGTGTLTVRRSKTDQDGFGKVLFLGIPTVELIRRYQRRSGISDDHLFRWINKGDRIAGPNLSEVSIRSIYKKRLRSLGIAGRISGHSLRIGTAQSLAASGASLVSMMDAGRWKSSSMPAHYVRDELAERSAVARLLYKHNG